MMRAVRFSAQLGYSIEEKTKEAIIELAPNLKNISAERIQVELVKLLQSPHPDYLRIAYDLGITKVILPEFDRAMETPQNNPHHVYNVGEHLLHTLSYVKPDRSLRIAALLHDIAKPDTEETDSDGISHFHGHADAGEEKAAAILRRLKFDNDTISKVKKYVKYHDYKIEPRPRAVRRALNKIGKEYFEQILELKQADMLAQSTYQREEKEENLRQVRALYEEILRKEECVSLKELALTGKDLMELGVPQGKQLGMILQQLLEDVLENPEHNTREYLVTLVQQKII